MPNRGNSCFFASTIQCLLADEQLKEALKIYIGKNLVANELKDYLVHQDFSRLYSKLSKEPNFCNLLNRQQQDAAELLEKLLLSWMDEDFENLFLGIFAKINDFIYGIISIPINGKDHGFLIGIKTYFERGNPEKGQEIEKLVTLPEIIIIHLKRFSYKGLARKNRDHMDYPDSFSMEPFFEGKEESEYQLFAVTVQFFITHQLSNLKLESLWEFH